MILSSKDRYGIIAMFDLAAQRGERPVPLVELSQKHNISVSYLEQLFAQLRRAGLVKSRRGPTGGYFLGRDASDITINDVVKAIRYGEESFSEFPRGDAASEGLKLWENFSHRMHHMLDEISLADVLRSIETGQIVHYPSVGSVNSDKSVKLN